MRAKTEGEEGVVVTELHPRLLLEGTEIHL